MTRNDIRMQFNKEKDLHVLQTEGTGYIHYTDDYVHWLEDIALKQANGVDTGQDKCHIQNVNGWLSFHENSKVFNELIKKDGDCLVKFDDGTILRFNEEFPFAVVTHFKPF